MNAILLVEDNADHEALAIRALRHANLTGDVIVARDGSEAIRYLLDPGMPARSVPLGLVLLDLKLPKVDGLEVLRRMRADPRTALLPVVVLTSSDEENDIRRSYQLGANSYVVKPVDYVQFVAVARQLVTYWFSLNQLPAGR
ncbi:MAG TPA: response regulator [Symbiobacteriaceae bacterium]|jgi:DNA-binding response OmpR family regulator|nr:response regulator [Symbiobacteriaceae bacterium]